MKTLADYEAWRAKQQQSGVGMTKIVLGQEFAAEPDAAAADMQLGQEFAQASGKPTPPLSMVKEYRPTFQRAIVQYKAGTILSSSPMLTEWLRQPGNADVARDDLENLSWWEGVGNALNRGVQTVEQSGNQLLASSLAQRYSDRGKSFGDIWKEQRSEVGVEGAILDQFTGPMTDLYFAGSRFLTAQLDTVFGDDTEGKAAFYQQRAAEIAQRVAAIPMTAGAEAFKQVLGPISENTDWQAQLGDFAEALVTNPMGATEFLVQTAIEFVPEIAAAAAVTAATRNPAAGAVFLGGASTVVSAGTQTLAFVQEAGHDLTTPEGALAALRDPGLMAEASRRGALYGVAVGIIDGLSGGVAGEVLAASPMGNMVVQMFIQAAMGGAGEAAGQIASGMPLNAVEIIVETLAEFVTAPVEVVGVGGQSFVQQVQRANAAETSKAVFQELSGQAVNSKLRERMPDRFRQFIDRATADGPVERVFVPAEKWIEYFQGIGVDPYELAGSLDGVTADDLTTALATGGDLSIPTATYAARIAGSEHDAFLIENMKFSPDDFTSVEAAEFNARAEDALTEAYDLADQLRRDEDGLRAVETEIYDEMVSRLRAAGRATDVATSEAMLYPAFYRTMAERSGVSVDEFMAKHPLPQVAREAPAALRDTSSLARTITEARARRTAGLDRGQSLLEFIAARGGIADPGGELKAMGADTVKRKGKKTLRVARGPVAAVRDMLGGERAAGHGFDDVARSVIEAGFMASEPEVLAYLEAQRAGTEVPDISRALLDAIRREIAGAPEYATAAPVADGLDTIEEYLAGLGVSLDDDVAAIKAAVDAAAGGRRYAQSADPRSNPAFREWFGDSKVVDAEGKPLVVYHATGADFDAFNPSRGVTFLSLTPGGAMKGAGGGSWDYQQKASADRIMPLYVRAEAIEHTQPPRHVVAEIEALPDEISVERYDGLREGRDGGFTRALSYAFSDGIERDGVWYVAKDMSKLFKPLQEVARTGRDWKGQILPGYNTSLDADARMGAGLQRRGYDATLINDESGVALVIADPTQIKSINNRGTFDPNDARLLFQDMGVPDGGARGSIALQPNGEAVISLFKTANLSTFLHESGHYFLSVMQQMAAADPGGSIATDYQVVKDWWHSHADDVAKDATRTTGVAVTGDNVRLALDAGTTGDAAMDAAIDTGMQEQFARATEQYLMEGKAPSIELRTAFEKFRAWLVSIYRRALGLNVEISDAMRGVFDRMLATDAEITQAKADAAITSPLTAEQLGMTPEQHAAFLKLHTQAQDDASAQLLAETMRPIRRAATEAYQAERARVKADVERNLKLQPVYRAIQELRFGRGFDGVEVQTLKLSREAIEKDYGAGYLPLLPGATKDGNGHRNAVFAHDGVHPDVVAEMYGLGTGRELLDRLANAPSLADAVEAETEKLMSERHPDPMLDGSIPQAALDAVHGDKRGQALAMELKALDEIAETDRGLTFKDSNETARRTLRTMRVKDAIRADRFLAAERKHGQEATRLTATVTREGMWMDRARRRVQTQARAAVREADASLTALPIDAANATTGRFNEDKAALVEAKRRQLLNHSLYNEARKIASEVESLLERAARLSRPDARQSKSRNIDYVKAARAIAARYGMTRPDSAFDFAMWADQLQADDPILHNALADAIATYSQNAKPYRELTVAELDAVKDAIESIMAIGKSARLLEIEGQAVEKELAISELIDQAEPRVKERAGIAAAPTKGMRAKIDLLTSGAALVRVEAWARDMDDGVAGPFTKYIVRPVMDALGRYRADRKSRMVELLSIIEPRREELLGKAIAAPELGYTFQNKGELLHAILHTGNESNLEKLLLGRGWSGGLIGQQQRVTSAGKPSVDRQGNPLMTRGRVDTAKWDAMIARLVSEGVVTKADYDTAQQIWDLMDALKRPAQSAHRKMHGYYFKEVEAAAVETPFGSYRGGYVPAIADPYASADAGIRQAAAALEQQHSAGMFPTTGAGFTKQRVQQYRTPLALNLMLLPSHMDKVLRFTHLEPVIRQTGALVTNKGLAGVIGAVNRDAVDSIILPWLQRTARQSVETPGMTAPGSMLNRISRIMRKRVGLHTMALNIVNAMQQLTGISSAAVLVKPGRLKSAMARFAMQPGVMRQEAIAASAFMRDRMDSSTRDMMARVEEIIVQPTLQGEVGAFVDKHGYVLQQGFQNVVDVIAWHGARDQAVAAGMGDADAVFEADSVIRRTQGSFNPEDVSLFESGMAFHRLFTMFYSYFNTQFNLLGGEAITTIRTMGWNGGPKLFSLYFFGFLIPAMVAEAIVQAARGELGDDDDDGYADDLVELFFGSQARFITGMVPVLGPLAIAALNRFNNKFYDDRLSTSPIVSVAERVVGAPASALNAATGEGSASRAVTDGLTLLGIILGIPTGQLAKSAGYAVKVGEGDAQPENLGDVIEGLSSGRDGSE